MALIHPLNAVISPINTVMPRMTLKTGTISVGRNNATIYASNKRKERKTESKNLPQVQQRADSNETIVTLLDEKNRQIQVMVQRIKKLMASKSTKYDHAEELVMIDAIQRLGLTYYFHDEINAALRRQYESFAAMEGHHDLHDTALSFRLLRQQGYNVSAGYLT